MSSTRITISVPDAVAQAVVREARRRGETVSALVRDAVEAYLRGETASSRELTFIGIGRSGKKRTARNAEAILRREWGDAGDR